MKKLWKGLLVNAGEEESVNRDQFISVIMDKWQFDRMDEDELEKAWNNLAEGAGVDGGKPMTVQQLVKAVMPPANALRSDMERVQAIARKYGRNVYAPNFFGLLDEDGDGKITVEEWIAGVTTPMKDIHELDATPARLRWLFGELDEDNSGEITEKELHEHMEKNSVGVSLFQGNVLSMRCGECWIAFLRIFCTTGQVAVVLAPPAQSAQCHNHPVRKDRQHTQPNPRPRPPTPTFTVPPRSKLNLNL